MMHVSFEGVEFVLEPVDFAFFPPPGFGPMAPVLCPDAAEIGCC